MVGQGSAEFLFIIGSVSGSDRRCQGAGKIARCPCLRSRIDSTPGDEIEGGAVLNVAAEKERGARDEGWKHGRWSRIGLEILFWFLGGRTGPEKRERKGTAIGNQTTNLKFNVSFREWEKIPRL